MGNRKKIHITRRVFVKQTSFFSVVGTFVITSCKSLLKRQGQATGPHFTEYDKTTLLAVFDHLLPSDYPRSPGANDINTLHFLDRTMRDKNFDAYEKRLIINGVKWVQETAIEMYDTYFHKLTHDHREAVLRDLETYSNGERWLSRMLTYIFEALLSDPVYGGNTDQLGWQWLQHQPGYPRPTPEKTYDKL